MSMTPAARDELQACIQSGFYSKEYLVERYIESYEDDRVAAEVEAMYDEVWPQVLDASAAWERPLDSDRLLEVFARLKSRAIVALPNTGYTQSDGIQDCVEEAHTLDDPWSVKGYCFFHEQDLVRAVRGEGLHLAYGAMTDVENAVHGTVIGRLVEEELKASGFAVEWDGTLESRIFIPHFQWRPTEALLDMRKED